MRVSGAGLGLACWELLWFKGIFPEISVWVYVSPTCKDISRFFRDGDGAAAFGAGCSWGGGKAGEVVAAFGAEGVLRRCCAVESAGAEGGKRDEGGDDGEGAGEDGDGDEDVPEDEMALLLGGLGRRGKVAGAKEDQKADDAHGKLKDGEPEECVIGTARVEDERGKDGNAEDDEKAEEV